MLANLHYSFIFNRLAMISALLGGFEWLRFSNVSLFSIGCSSNVAKKQSIIPNS